MGLPVWVPAGTIATLAEHIAVVMRNSAQNPDGLKVFASIDLPSLPDLTREVLRASCGATHVVEIEEPDPDLGPDTVILRN